MNHLGLSERILVRESKRSAFVSEVLLEAKKDPLEFFSFLIEKHSNVKSVNAERIEILQDFLKNNFYGFTSEIYPEEMNGFLVHKDDEFNTSISIDSRKILLMKSIKNVKRENLEFIEQDDKLLETLDRYFNTEPESKEYYKEVEKLVLEKIGKNVSGFNHWILWLHSNVRKIAKEMYVKQLQIKRNNLDFLSEMDLISYQNRLEKVFFQKNSELINFLLKSGYSIQLENFNQTREELIGGMLK